MKPVLVDSKKLDDLMTKEVEMVFGYKDDYTKLDLHDLEFITQKCKNYENFTVQELTSLCKGVSQKEVTKFQLSRTERLKRLGQGFSIQAFEALLKPLTEWFH